MEINKYSSLKEVIWIKANSEPILLDTVKKLEGNNMLSGKEIGDFITKKYSLNWSDASQNRNGGAIKQWAMWLYEGKMNSIIPPCPGRT